MIFDPVVHYDEYLKRFWLICAANDGSQHSEVLIALSNDSDTTFGWSLFSVDMTQDGSNQTSNWCDYPNLGIDTQAIYISCNMFSLPVNSSSSFQYAKVRIMAKSQFVKDTCCSWHDQWNMPFTLQPAVMHHAKDSDGEFLVDSAGNQGSDVQVSGGGGDTGDTLDVWHFPDPLGNPSQLDQTTASVSAYGPAPSAREPGSNLLDTGDARLLSAIWQDGHLTSTQNTLCSNNACAAFYELDVSSFPNVSVVNDWALQAAGSDYYYPAVEENEKSNKALVYTISGPGQNPSAAYVLVPNSKTCTGCTSAPQVLMAKGTSPYANFGLPAGPRNRWGDYFSAGADPDGVGVWVAGEFSNGAASWAVQVAPTYATYQPKLKISPTTLKFPDLTLETGSAQDVTLTNTGNANLTIKSMQINGATDYSLITNTCAIPLPTGTGVLEPGQACVATVFFKPKTAGELKAGLQICDTTQTTCIAHPKGDYGQVSISGSGMQTSFRSLKPDNSPVNGGITVAATGDDLNDKLKFDFGGSPATDVACSSSASCTMVVPAHSPGSVSVTTETAAGKVILDHFDYQAPAIKSINPATGPTAGGQSVTLNGVGFYPLMTVKFGEATVYGYNSGIKTDVLDCPSDVLCYVTSPPGTGSVHITASLNGFTSDQTSADLFNYEVFPSITSVTPASGPVTGGTLVTVNGANFSATPGETTFKFGGLPATGVTCSSTQCTVTAPVRPEGSTYLLAVVTATVGGNTSIDGVSFSFGTPPTPTPPPPLPKGKF